MLSSGELLALGVQHHQRGAVQEAERLYRQALEADPNNPEVLFYFGIAAQHLGRSDVGVEHISRAITLRPGVAVFHCYLGLAYWALGRQQEALAAYEDAIRLDPNYADAHNNLGVALQRLGRMAEATACFEQAVRCNPDFAEARSNLGAAYQDQGRLAEAIANFEHAVRCKPDFAGAHNNLGVVAMADNRPEDALIHSREAVRLEPGYAEAHYNLGLALKRLDRLDEAIEAFQQALHHRPGYADAYNDLGLTYHTHGRLQDALAQFEEAIRLRPDFADAHLARASTLLMAGDFKPGWQEYEWRWRCTGFVAPPLRSPRPAWDGSPLNGRTLLIRAEQGFGDTFQFIRYVALLKERGGRIILEAQPRLIPLLKNCPGIDGLFALEDEPPPYDLHAYMLSLPRLLRTTLDDVPVNVPYLAADPALVEEWRKELQANEGFKIGISWQGNPTQKADRIRSFPLTHFAALAELEGIHLISLQKGVGSEQIRACGFPVIDLAHRLDETAGAFMDTAAVLMSLDLVITVDSAVAHLAGALGVPVWVPLSFSPDWRWLLEREDSPWYPTMRLFRQTRLGDWTGVFQRIRAALRDVVAGNMPAAPQWSVGRSLETHHMPMSLEDSTHIPTENRKPKTENPEPVAPILMAPPIASALSSSAPVAPEPFDPYNLMGAALLAQGKPEAAVALWEQALLANPRSADGHNNLAVCLSRLGRPEEALDHFRQALALKPNFPEAHTNMGTAFWSQGKRDEALACFDRALRARPDFAEAHLARAHARLIAGDLAQGWPEHEWRMHCPNFGAQFYAANPQPTWDGSPLDGRTILLRAEQGFGDTIQFVRYVPLVQERGGRVIVEAQPRLLPLLSNCSGVLETVCQGDILPPFDVQALLLSLPLVFGTTLETIPAGIPYLAADPALMASWQRELAALDGFKVGIAWQGQAANPMDRLRSAPLLEFAPLADVEGVHLISLQKGAGTEQLPAATERFPVIDLASRLDETTGAFMDTAAVLMSLDLVVTVDTAIAHLAGALGAPVWLALGVNPDWRWLLERQDTPWYPSMRLFRQQHFGRWDAVFAHMAKELRNIVRSKSLTDFRCKT